MINLFCSIGWLGKAALGIGVGSLINGLFGSGTNAIQYNQQKKLMQKQFEYQKQMYDYTFDKQTQYNLPSEQLARMKKAGLNPNLAYGQVQAAGSSGVTGSAPNASPPPLNAHQVDLASMVQANTQRSLSNTQQDLNKSQEDYNKAETQGQIIENAFKARQYGGENGARLAAALLKTAENQADYWEIHKDTESVTRNNEVIRSSLLVAEERNINAKTALDIINAAIAGLMPMQIYQQIRESNSRISLNAVNETYLTALAGQAGATEDQIRELTKWLPSLNQWQINKIAQEIQSSRNNFGMFSGFANNLENIFKMIESWFTK